MRCSILTTALLSLAPSALAVGTAHVVNNCGVPVYFQSVSQGVWPSMDVLPAEGYSQSFDGSGSGVSIKMALSASGPVTQFEFTLAGGSINYDISNIDGNPFAQGGMSLAPSVAGDSAFPTCQVVNCPAGQSYCDAAYNQPNDVRTMVCPSSSDLTFTLCPAGPMKREEPAFPFNLVKRFHARQFK